MRRSVCMDSGFRPSGGPGMTECRAARLLLKPDRKNIGREASMHRIDIPQNIRDRALRARGREYSIEAIDPARTAHLVVDLQNGFMAEGAPLEVPVARAIVPNVNRIGAALRAAGGLNVFLRYTH